MEQRLQNLKKAKDTQGTDGNWNNSGYMRGMYNGMELAVAILEDREPEYKDAPEGEDAPSIAEARQQLIQAFKDDPDFRDSYVANIACVIMDHAKGFARDKPKRDALAEKIMAHIFC